MRIEKAGITHVGMKRSHNEDSFLMLPEECLYVVADGMGGHASGEIASRIAVDELGEFYRLTGQDQELTWPYKMDKARNYDENRLATGIKLANMRIFERAAQTPVYKGMGTTIVSVHFTQEAVYVAHVGDSRVYRYRQGQLTQLTEDHSLLNDYLKARKLTQEEIDAFPAKNVIVRALGMKDSVQVDLSRNAPEDGDIYLLCSDGLSGMATDQEMAEILAQNSDLQAACDALIARANKNGGNDNVTCILAQYWGS